MQGQGQILVIVGGRLSEFGAWGEGRGERDLVTSPALAAPQESGNNEVIFMALDLASLASVRAFATAFLRSEPRLDILIHNAGEMQALSGAGVKGGSWRGSHPFQPARHCWGSVAMWERCPQLHLTD